MEEEVAHLINRAKDQEQMAREDETKAKQGEGTPHEDALAPEKADGRVSPMEVL